MTAAGLVATGIVLTLLAVRELARLRADGATPPGWSRLDTALPPAVVAWCALVVVRLADYLG